MVSYYFFFPSPKELGHRNAIKLSVAQNGGIVGRRPPGISYIVAALFRVALSPFFSAEIFQKFDFDITN